MVKSKKIKSILIAGIVVVVSICILPLTKNVHIALAGTELRLGNDETSEEVLVKIKGTYKNYLFRNDTFKGYIIIDKYDFTEQYEVNKLVFSDGYAYLSYPISSDYMRIPYNFGIISCNSGFSRVVIGVNETGTTGEGMGWSGEDGLMIVAPAGTREDAIAIGKELWRKSDFLSEGVNWE